MDTTRITFDNARLLHALEGAFSSSATFLAELAQNARRSRASQVDFTFVTDAASGRLDLEVRDDGCGLGDFDTLFCLARSGWDLEIVTREAPFGVGFLAALYACEHLRAASRGRVIDAATADLLAGAPIPIQTAATPPTGTLLTLRGLRSSRALLQTALERYARGFPLPVLLNGQPLLRPDARAQLPCSGHALGDIHLPGWDDPHGAPVDLDGLLRREPTLYLHGLPVGHPAPGGAIVHLDATAFRPRWPDRERLYDHEACLARITAAVYAVLVAQVAALKRALPEAEFLARLLPDRGAAAARGGLNAPEDERKDLLALLTDVHVLHPRLLCKAAYPRENWAEVVAQGFGPGPAGRTADSATWLDAADLAAGRVTLVDLSAVFYHASNPLSWMAAHAGATVLGVRAPYLLPSWARPYLRQETDLALRLYGPVAVDSYDPDNLYATYAVAFCARYAIVDRVTGAEVAVVDSDALLVSPDTRLDPDTPLAGVDAPAALRAAFTAEEPEGLFIVPRGEATGAVVTQASDFEGNEYLEDNETQRFRAFIACQRDDPLAALSTVLNRTADYLGNHLRGRTVTLRVDERGVFHLTPAAA